MKYYAKVPFNGDADLIKENFSGLGINEFEVILDKQVQQKSKGSVYNQMKEELLESHDSLCIDSLFSLGKNAREITKELEWFAAHDIEIYVLDIPSTLKNNFRNVDILYEVNVQYAAREIAKIREGQKKSAKNTSQNQAIIQKKPVGRPKVPYPDNWEEEYKKWKNHETSSKEFMANVKLSQGTFYNFLRQYKEDLLYLEEEKAEKGCKQA